VIHLAVGQIGGPKLANQGLESGGLLHPHLADVAWGEGAVHEHLRHRLAAHIPRCISPGGAVDGAPVQGVLCGGVTGMDELGVVTGSDAIGHQAGVPLGGLATDLQDRQLPGVAALIQVTEQAVEHGVTWVEEQRHVAVQVHALLAELAIGAAGLTARIREIDVGQGLAVDAGAAEQPALGDARNVMEVGEVKELGDRHRQSWNSVVLLFRPVRADSEPLNGAPITDQLPGGPVIRVPPQLILVFAELSLNLYQSI